MDKREILRKVDHTLLKPEANWAAVQQLCDEAIEYETASICISSVYVKRAADYVAGRIPVCTVVGFPSGAVPTSVKVYETTEAVKDGASEIDMVISIGSVKNGDWDEVLQELKAVKLACKGRVLKVIIEACLLTEQEKIKLCQLVSESGAEFIKTSTGFSTGGATPEDVALFRRYCAPYVKIKAAGGVRTWETAEEMLRLGADRLGSSALVMLAKEANI